MHIACKCYSRCLIAQENMCVLLHHPLKKYYQLMEVATIESNTNEIVDCYNASCSHANSNIVRFILNV